MGAELPEIEPAEFAIRLQRCSPIRLSAGTVANLWGHYQELRRWNRAVSLVGPIGAAEVVERHYGESLAALQLLEPSWRRVVDIGSGAGFPGLVLAIVDPSLDVYLVEARERKWAFLTAVCRQISLSCRCLNARVDQLAFEGLPEEIDLVTARAVKVASMGLEGLVRRLVPDGGVLLWTGAGPERLSAPLELVAELPFEGAQSRRIRKYVRRPVAD